MATLREVLEQNAYRLNDSNFKLEKEGALSSLGGWKIKDATNKEETRSWKNFICILADGSKWSVALDEEIGVPENPTKFKLGWKSGTFNNKPWKKFVARLY